MSNTNNNFELTNMIEVLLAKKKTVRDNDDLLYAEICKKLNPNVTTASFTEVMTHRVKYGIPVYESVRRARASIQKRNPELRGKTYEQSMRSKKRCEYLDYSPTVKKAMEKSPKK